MSDRLTTDKYKRPKYTKTDTLTKEEIKELLEDYEKVDDIGKVKIGSSIRYFDVADPDNKKFRYGGTLVNISCPNYVVLSAKGKSWSVQINDAIFFKRINVEELKKEYEEIFSKLEEKYRKVKKENKLLLKENEELLEKNRKLENYIRRHQ